MESTYLAAVDIGASKITVSLADDSGILVKVYQETWLAGEPEAIPNQVDTLIQHCCRVISIETRQVSAVGISSAGPFVKRDGKITLVSPNICGGLASENDAILNNWTSVPLEDGLLKHYHKVRIGNDAVTGAVAERTFGAGIGVDNLVYVTWSTGIGTGAFVDGRLIQGKNGNAPHGGHIFIVEDGPQCGCGGSGHLEALSSGTAIARDYGEPASKCFDDYRRGDHKAKEIVESAARNFARGLVSITVMLDTRLFIIGGSVFLNNGEILLPLVRYDFKHLGWNVFSGDVSIIPSQLRDSLPDLAALSLVMPKEWVEDWRETKPWEQAPETTVLE